MKTYLVIAILSLLFPTCTPVHSLVDRYSQSSTHFRQFTDLADALRNEPGLLVSGFGRTVNIQSRRSPHEDLLYVLNGMDVGTNYHAANDLLNMDQVVWIRVSRNLAERTITGKANAGGIVEIRTR